MSKKKKTEKQEDVEPKPEPVAVEKPVEAPVASGVLDGSPESWEHLHQAMTDNAAPATEAPGHADAPVPEHVDAEVPESPLAAIAKDLREGTFHGVPPEEAQIETTLPGFSAELGGISYPEPESKWSCSACGAEFEPSDKALIEHWKTHESALPLVGAESEVLVAAGAHPDQRALEHADEHSHVAAEARGSHPYPCVVCGTAVVPGAICIVDGHRAE